MDTNIKTSNLRTMSQMMSSIAESYFASLNAVLKGEKGIASVLSDSESNARFEKHRMIIKVVEDIFTKLDPISREIINNDFFHNENKFWWIKIYPTSTYYRLKNTALRDFLELYSN